jgi:mRNA interferase RelE/StbE
MDGAENEENEWTVILRPRARKDIQRLTRQMRRRVKAALMELARGPRQATNVKQLSLSERIYRKRIGDYRILFTIDDEARKVFVHGVPHRSDAY